MGHQGHAVPSPFVLPGVPVADSIGPDSDQRRHGALLERVEDTIKRVPLPLAHVRVEALEGMETVGCVDGGGALVRLHA